MADTPPAFTSNPTEPYDDTPVPRYSEHVPDNSRRIDPTLQAADASNAIKLGRPKFYVPLLVLFYTVISVFPWVIVCILNFRPIKTSSYSLVLNANSDYSNDGRVAAQYKKNNGFFPAARVLITISGVLAIPIASSVLANATIPFLQNTKSRYKISMRKTLTLADRGWMSFRMMLIALRPSFGQHYRNRFLSLGMLLVVIGVFAAPLQQYFIRSETIKVPTGPKNAATLIDIKDLFNAGLTFDDNFLVVELRKLLAETTGSDYQSYLWRENPNICSENAWSIMSDPGCSLYQPNLNNFSAFSGGPFFAQVPVNLNTGVIRQFAPRINSTVVYRDITNSHDDSFPSNCDQIPGSFYFSFENTTSPLASSSIKVCIPYDLSISPFKSTRDRQDISESLYLQVYSHAQTFWEGNATLKLTVNTSVGYFELPNYMNKGIPGPLLDKDPSYTACGKDCTAELDSSDNSIESSAYPEVYRKREISTDGPQFEKRQSSTNAIYTVNKGPLTLLALALFGEGSFLTVPGVLPSAFRDLSPPPSSVCRDIAPLAGLLTDSAGNSPLSSWGGYCFSFYGHEDDTDDHGFDQASWTSWFINTEYMQGALAAGIFLASQTWIAKNRHVGGKLTIEYDMGMDFEKPVISTTGIIVGSIFLGIFLLGLISLTIYASFPVRWTERLDAFAMLRIGASHPKEFPLLHAKDPARVKALDEIQGYVGDALPSGPVGLLAVGTAAPIRKGRPFVSYDKSRLYTDHFPYENRTRLPPRRHSEPDIPLDRLGTTRDTEEAHD